MFNLFNFEAELEGWSSIAPNIQVESEVDEEAISITELDMDPTAVLNEVPEPLPSKRPHSSQIVTAEHFKPKPVSLESYRKLNEQQTCALNFVMEWAISQHTATPQQPFYVYIEGAAGTRKSLLINCIAGKATDFLASLQEDISTPSVLLTSFTGTAAYNIRGQTLHAAFRLPTSLRLPYQPIPEKALNTLRSRFRNLKILITDEISMISKTLLLYVHGRLTQLYQSKAFQPFGGISVLVVGDLFQLPPVFGPPLFKINHAALPAELFTFFQKYSLTKIVRQKDDLPFITVLNVIRKLRKNERLPRTLEALLRSRIISETLPEPTFNIFANLTFINIINILRNINGYSHFRKLKNCIRS